MNYCDIILFTSSQRQGVVESLALRAKLLSEFRYIPNKRSAEGDFGL